MNATPCPRACALCTHGTGPLYLRHCTAPAVAATGPVPAPVPVHLARANSGRCGPEAQHLSFPGLLAA
jgi:hypothetical protein